MPNQTWQIRYGDGTGASGIVYQDVVSIGDPTSTQPRQVVSFPNQVVQIATSVSAGLTDDPYASGLMGLGMSSGNRVRPTPAKTFMDNIRSSLAQPLFTANLRHTQPGTYSFGFINSSEHNTRIGYTPVNRDSIYWEFATSGFAVGSSPRQSQPWTVLADTGTSLLLVPDFVVNAYYAQVPGSGYSRVWAAMIFPCATELPDWSFYVPVSNDGRTKVLYKGTVPGRYMNYAQVNTTHCYGGMQSSEEIGVSIFGDVLLKAQLVVFDLGGMRIGFAGKRLGA